MAKTIAQRTAAQKRSRRAEQAKNAEATAEARAANTREGIERALGKEGAAEPTPESIARGIGPTIRPANPETITIYNVVSDEQDKERYKMLRGQLHLSPADQATCKKVASEFLDVYDRKGTVDENGNPIPALTRLEAMKQASQNKLRTVVWTLALHAGRKAKDKPELLLVWFDLLCEYTENQERRADRDAREAADMRPVRELFGGYWVTTKSEIRRSMKKGFMPRDFNSANAYIQASKPAAKKRGAGGSTNQTEHRETDRAPIDAALEKQHPAVVAAIHVASDVAQTVREADKPEYANLLASCARLVKGMSADPKSPYNGMVSGVSLLLTELTSLKGDVRFPVILDAISECVSKIRAAHTGGKEQDATEAERATGTM